MDLAERVGNHRIRQIRQDFRGIVGGRVLPFRTGSTRGHPPDTGNIRADRIFLLILQFAGHRLFDLVDKGVHRRFLIHPPIHRPQADHLPAQFPEDADLDDLPVTGGAGFRVVVPVAQDAQDIVGARCRVHNADVDPVARAADVRADGISTMTELHRNGLHEAVRLDGRLGGITERGTPLFGIFKEGLQAGDSLRRGALEVDLVGCEGGEDLHLIAGAGNSHVQTAPSTFPVERAEVHGDPPILVLAVTDREEDHIPLVALHVLQVLDEDRFLGGHRQLFQIGLFGEQVREQVLDEGLLVGIESHHADAAPTEVGILQTTADLGDDGLGFRPVLPRPFLSPVVDAIHMFIGQFGIQIIRRGERKERVLVELGVAEGDKAFVLAPIVPAEMLGREGKGKAVIEDAVQILHLGVILVKGILVEEIGRRHLLLVADHDDALAAGDGAHRLAGRHLRGLVEDDKVELRPPGIKVLRHR